MLRTGPNKRKKTQTEVWVGVYELKKGGGWNVTFTRVVFTFVFLDLAKTSTLFRTSPSASLTR